MFARFFRTRSRLTASRPVTWRRNLIYIAVLLSAWLAINVGVVLRADCFESGAVAGRRAYWVAAYWAPMSYLALIGLYLWLMRKHRRRP
ncbi:MAG: DUF4212 domain-containing protein [Burkholderiaceae bacterium]|nr:DUF4212 domain-containing protein [Burkholderiaceae bacterium]